MPSRVREELSHSHPPDLVPESNLHRMAQLIVNYVGLHLPDPEPLDMGGNSPILGKVTGLQLFDSRTSEDPDSNYVSYFVEYSNGHRTEASATFRLSEFPGTIGDLIWQVHRDSNIAVKEWFWSQYGHGELIPQEWQSTKLEVFISHRPSGASVAGNLFHQLGSYQDCSVFLPRMDLVDLQAGNWLDQLMDMIRRCPVFVPILTDDYLQGPISRPELDQALRRTLHQKDKRIVPVLVEGRPEDYEDHFVGGYQMVLAQSGLSSDLLESIARMCLGVSRNPYE